MKRMPVIFAGHGDPMIALRDDEMTKEIAAVGRMIKEKYGKPKAILAISAHWYTDGTYIQTAEKPRQIYDMYGFPPELYEVKYPARGCAALSGRVRSLLGEDVSANDSRGIDHGTWTLLIHMFPEADIPVVQLSVDGSRPAGDLIDIGRKLAALRNEGYLIIGSGNIVHNLMRADWSDRGGTDKTVRFADNVTEAVKNGKQNILIHYEDIPDAAYAVPTPDHYLPLIYCVGAADGDKAEVFNNAFMLGTIAMTGYIFGM